MAMGDNERGSPGAEAPSERLAGSVERVTFHSEDSGQLVAVIDYGGGLDGYARACLLSGDWAVPVV